MDLRRFMGRYRRRVMFNGLFISIMLGALVAGYAFLHTPASAANSSGLTADEAFTRAAQETGVPIELLKAICYTEGRLSNNSGLPSRDAGFGCMHLVKNGTVDTLDKAAVDLGVSVAALKQDMPTNIRGGAAVLRDEALQLSPGHTLPANLSDWYNTLLVYSTASNHDVAGIFANEIYKTIQRGFRAPTDKGEIVNLPAEQVQLNVANTATLPGSLVSSTLAQPGLLSTQKSPEGAFINTVTRLTNTLPSTCANGQTDSNVDYPGAIDCLLSPPTTYDCNNLESPGNCNYTGSDRPTSCSVFVSPSAPLAVTQPCNVDQIVIHDTDSSLASTLNEFLCLGNDVNDPTCVQSSVHYIIDTDGTIYQVVHEHDIAYHDGNFWSNMHSIGIEHVGFDATGYLWYNTAQYTASAKLVASLLKKYHLPLDRDHVVAHGTVPSPTLASSPNHVDPGPYWLWDYYFHLINQRGVPLNSATPLHTITLHPKTDQRPFGPNGTETPANFNFFNLYNGPSTSSGLIPAGNTSDITDITYNIEPGMSYYYLAKVPDAAGTGDTMYEIWYGVEDQLHLDPPSFFAGAKKVWLAVPRGAGVEGRSPAKPGKSHSSSVVAIVKSSADIYGRPTSASQYIIGSAPLASIFYSGYTLVEDNTSNLWYEINFNHRHAWVPSSEVVLIHL